MSHDALVQHALALESRLSDATQRIRDLEAQLGKRQKVADNTETGPSDTALTDAQIKENPTKLTDVAQREIKKQMKWVPSCKRGTAKWSYTASVPEESVLYAMLNLTVNPKNKKWKQKKLPVRDFERAVGNIEARIRYGYVVHQYLMLEALHDSGTRFVDEEDLC